VSPERNRGLESTGSAERAVTNAGVRRWLRPFRGFAFYPILAAIYAPLRIAAGNAAYITVLEVVAVVGACAASALILSATVFAAARRRWSTDKIALGTLTILVWLFNAEAIADQGLWVGLRSRTALGVLSVIMAAVLVWILRSREIATIVSSTARTAIAALALFAFGEFLVRHAVTAKAVERSAFRAHATAPLPPATVAPPDSGKNLYILILDNFANSAVLASRYGIDDAPFRDTLTALGLTVSTTGRSNYGFTAPSVGSILSADHVRALEQDPEARKAAWDILFAVARQSRVLAAFTRAGYRAYVVKSAFFEGTQTSDVATVYVPRSSRSVFVRFARLPLARFTAHETIIGRLVEKSGRVLIPAAVELAPFDGMIELAAAPDRKVVVAHSLVSHPPFMFDAECRLAGRILGDSSMYIAAVRCTHRQVLRTIRGIQAHDTSPAIIVIGDHGPLPPNLEHAPAERISPAQAFERFGAFRATLLPPAIALTDSTTHLNVIRRTLVALLGVNLPDVPDRSYWSSLFALDHFVAVDSLLDEARRGESKPPPVSTRAGRR
jgi:hypothetical protein